MLLIPISFFKAAAASGNPANPSFTFSENFDSPGYSNSWTEAGSTIDADYTGDVLQGTQSVRLVAAVTAPRVFAGVTSEITKHGYFQVKINSMAAATNVIYSLRATGTIMFSVSILSDGKLRIQHNGATADTVDALTAGVKYHIWIGYTAGSGSNGTAYVAFSTDGVRPMSGNKTASISNGTGTSNINRVYCGTTTNSTYDIIIDRVLLAQSDIYDNP